MEHEVGVTGLPKAETGETCASDRGYGGRGAWDPGEEETRLARSATGFRAIIENGHDIVSICDADNTIRYVSPSVKRVMGYEPGELVGRCVPELIHPDDRETAEAEIEKIESRDRHEPPVIRYRKKDGSWVYLESVTTNLTHDETINGIVVHARDVTERVQMEEALAASEARFRALVENASDFIALADAENVALYASPSIERIMGYTPEEFVGTHIAGYIHPDDLEAGLANVAESLGIPGPHTLDTIRYVHKDGSFRWLEVTVNNQVENPALRGVICNCRDITERVEAEERLRESEEFHRAVNENALDFVVVQRADNTLSYASPSVERLLGWKPEEVVGRMGADFIHPDDLEWAWPLFYKQLNSASGITDAVNIRYLHKDGSWRWFESACNNQFDNPVIGGLVFNCRDVTERVEAEEKLRESEKRYRMLVEQVPAVNYTLVPAPEGEPGTMTNGSLSYISPQVENLLGYPPERFFGEPEFWSSLIHPGDLDAVLAEDERTDETGEAFEMEYRMRRSDGRYIWVKDDAALVEDAAGCPLLWQCVLSDITRRREAEEEVRRLNEDLEGIVEKRTAQLMGALEEAEDSEELMRLSESRYRSLVQRSSDITAVVDRDGAVIYMSPAVEVTLGYRAAELMEERIPERVHKDDRARLFAAFERVFAEEAAAENVEFRFRHSDGSWRSLDAVLTNLADEPGVAGIVVNARDVTDKKRAEGRYRTLVEQLPLVTYVENAETNLIEYMSPQIESLLGYPAEQYKVERSLRQRSILPEDYEWVRAEDERTDRTGEPYSVEHRRVTADGRLVWVRDEAVLVRDDEGRPMYWQGIVEDITERKEAEDELKRNLNVLLALYETGQILTSTLDLDTRGERLLEVMAGLFGLRAAAIELAAPDDGLRPWKSRGDDGERRLSHETPAYIEARRDALTDGKPRAFRQSVNESLPSEGVCLPLRSRGRVVGFVEAFGDKGLGQKENLDVFASLGNQSGSALENARLYSELAAREARLEELVGKLITAQEEERKRVAYEIHDGLAQSMIAASQKLQTFLEDFSNVSSAERISLERVMELVRRSGDEARRVIANLRPTVLDDFGLAAALRIHVESLRRDGLAVGYVESLGEKRLPPHVETALYRVAQEALNNVRKHAPEANAELSIRLAAARVEMTVSDDGPGFDPSRVGNGSSGGPGERVGLSSMRERITLLGGRFEVDGDGGTHVFANVPVQNGSRGGDGA